MTCNIEDCDRHRHLKGNLEAAVCTPHYYAIKRGLDFARSKFNIPDLEPP